MEHSMTNCARTKSRAGHQACTGGHTDVPTCVHMEGWERRSLIWQMLWGKDREKWLPDPGLKRESENNECLKRVKNRKKSKLEQISSLFSLGTPTTAAFTFCADLWLLLAHCHLSVFLLLLLLLLLLSLVRGLVCIALCVWRSMMWWVQGKEAEINPGDERESEFNWAKFTCVRVSVSQSDIVRDRTTRRRNKYLAIQLNQVHPSSKPIPLFAHLLLHFQFTINRNQT